MGIGDAICWGTSSPPTLSPVPKLDMTTRSHDTTAGILIAAVCIAYLRGAQGLQSPLVADPLGPSAFPTILGWSGLILAVAQIVLAWSGRRAADETPDSFRQYVKPLVLFGLLIAYAIVV